MRMIKPLINEDKRYTNMNYQEIYNLFWNLYYSKYYDDLHDLSWLLIDEICNNLTNAEKKYIISKIDSAWQHYYNNVYLSDKFFYSIPDKFKDKREYVTYFRRLNYCVPIGQYKILLYKKLVNNIMHNKYLQPTRKKDYISSTLQTIIYNDINELRCYWS